MNITQFSMEEVRCFAERQNFEIRPLTFLVGENSTGKTTALACFQILADYLSEGEVDFNRPPYSMGIFSDIVRNSKKKEKTFELGFTFRHRKEDVECIVEFAKKKEGIEPDISLLTVRFIDGEIVCEPRIGVGGDAIRLVSSDEENNKYHIAYESGLQLPYPSFYLYDLMSRKSSKGAKALVKYLRKKEGGVRERGYTLRMSMHNISVFSTSPIRSRPKRTYDPTRIFDDPEGSDVPMRLMRAQATQKEEWKTLKERLVEFGERSGLFQNIEIKNLGRSMGTPFQLKVKVRGPNANIIDVGYGVSQILPILVQILDPPSSSGHMMVERAFFLLQQPEVHLHPRAQAELSSLLAAIASQSGRSFIVETHSDYMIDRARIEIRKGTIRPEDVSLIYLEPKGRVVKVHNIRFDEMGEMVNIPKAYRDFFMKETVRLMGFED